ncbi:MAG: hypothetical protein ACK5LV_01810 [Lachnospirales bacterium]
MTIAASIVTSFFVIMFIILVIGVIIGSKKVVLESPTGDIKIVRKNFSFTYCFFGFFVPLFRNHMASFFVSIILDFLSFGLLRSIYCFMINRHYISYLQEKGYRIVG